MKVGCCDEHFTGNWYQFIFKYAIDELESIHERLPRFVKKRLYARYLTNKILVIDSSVKDWLKYKKLSLVDQFNKKCKKPLQHLRIYGIVFEDGTMISVKNPLVFLEMFYTKIENESIEPIALVFVDKDMENFYFTTDSNQGGSEVHDTAKSLLSN